MALYKELKSQGDFLFRYRSYLPVIIILVGIAVFVYNNYFESDNSIIFNHKYQLICLGIGLFGLFIRVMTLGYTAPRTSGRNTSAGQIATTVNRTGMYSLCRHPLYLGNYFMWLGIAMFTADFWFLMAFTFLYWVYYERIIYAEERFLIDQYGEQYTDWSKETNAFFPQLNKWKPSKYDFSARKVIRQEKTGILNLFVVAFVFKAIQVAILDESIPMLWYGFLGFGVLWYIVIKTIQKTTNWLKTER